MPPTTLATTPSRSPPRSTDLWATVLHKLGLDHEKLTYLYAGRNVRLTDLHGNVWKDLVT